MLYTGSYDNNCKASQKCHLVSISGDHGLKAGFTGDKCSSLAPKLEFWKTWEANIGKISTPVNNTYYLREYYEGVLKGLDPNLILGTVDYDAILLCYEQPHEFCHRQIVAVWLEEKLQCVVPEVKTTSLGLARVRANYRGFIRKALKEIMND